MMKKYQVVISAKTSQEAEEFIDESGLIRQDTPTKTIVPGEFVLVVLDPADNASEGDNGTVRILRLWIQTPVGAASVTVRAWNEITGSSSTPDLGEGGTAVLQDILTARLDLGMHKGSGEYCRVHDLFDCWFSHGPAHADRRRV